MKRYQVKQKREGTRVALQFGPHTVEAASPTDAIVEAGRQTTRRAVPPGVYEVYEVPSPVWAGTFNVGVTFTPEAERSADEGEVCER